MIIRESGASYLSDPSSVVPMRDRSSSFLVKKFGATILALSIFMSLMSGLIGNTSVVKADDDSKDFGPTMSKSIDDFMKQNHLDPKSALTDFVNSVKNPSPDSFGTVLIRLFTVGYINHTPKASVPSGMQFHEWNCSTTAKGAGTPLYHNCDVPNFITEALQDLLGAILPSGPQNATTASAKSFMGMGIPSTIPGDGKVPIDPNQRNIKYTALEVMGYSPKYTSYLGEWDHIKVMTQSRALSNFSMMDDINLSINTLVQATTKGMKVANNKALEGLKQGNLIKAVTGFYAGFFDAAATASVTSILDTSDLNVFNSYAWYRVGYGNTLYNARELNQTEIAAIIKSYLQDLFNSSKPDEAKVPADFSKLQPGPPKPKENISKCEAKDPKDNSTKEIKDDSPTGINEEDCKQQAKEQYQDENPKWSVDGTQKKETLEEWKKNNKDFLDKGSKENIKCDMNTNESDRVKNIANFYTCWDKGYNDALTKKMSDEQGKQNQSWVDKLLKLNNIIKFFLDSNSRTRNFNAPWSRFVCTDSNGKDLVLGAENTYHNHFVFLYDDNGTLNSKCSAPRPPIQNGIFGNGYDPKQPNQTPGVDTRNKVFAGSGNISDKISSPLFIFGTSGGPADFGLTVAKFSTTLSNTIIDLGFSPLLQRLGITKLMISFVEGFRDSVFYPFMAMIIALSALQIFFSTIKNKNYQQGFISLFLIVAVSIFGIFVLYQPKKVFDASEDIPSRVETAILGTIFTTGNADPDGLCTATQTVSTSNPNGLDGKSLSYSPRAATRTLECSVWRAFVFNPWVQGQWGTSYDNLYSASAKTGSHFTNKNTAIVGEPTVNLGGGTKINNWALYQLDILKTGTSTTDDYSVSNGQVPRNFYKLVDLQAGPNNGSQSDARYFDNWNGINSWDRVFVGLISGAVGVVGLITIFSFMFFKIEITLLFAIMLLLLPFMFLLGINPTFGRLQLKKYAGTLISLLLQRLLLITLFSILIRILIAFTNTGNYLLAAFLSVCLCMAAMMYRKTIMDMITSSVASSTGGVLAQDKVNNPNLIASAGSTIVPKTLRNQITLEGAKIRGGVGAGIGSVVAGRGFRAGYKEGSGFERNVARNKLMRSGQLSQLSKFNEARIAGDKAAGYDTNKRRKYQSLSGNSSTEQAIREQVKLHRMKEEDEKVKQQNAKHYLDELNKNSTEQSDGKKEINDSKYSPNKKYIKNADNLRIDLSDPANHHDLIQIQRLDKRIVDIEKRINVSAGRVQDQLAREKRKPLKDFNTEENLELSNEIKKATQKYHDELDILNKEKDLYVERLSDRVENYNELIFVRKRKTELDKESEDYEKDLEILKTREQKLENKLSNSRKQFKKETKMNAADKRVISEKVRKEHMDNARRDLEEARQYAHKTIHDFTSGGDK